MLPFHTTIHFGTKVASSGCAIPKADGLHLVIHEGELPVNVLEAETRTVRIPWDGLSGIEVRKGILADTVVLSLIAGLPIPEVPGFHEQAIELSVLKRDRDQIDWLLTEVDTFRSGTKLDTDVDAMIDDVRKFLDP